MLGDMRETLPAAGAQLGGRIALAHLDAGTGEVAASRALADEVAPLIVPLMRMHGILVSEPVLAAPGLKALPLPAGVDSGRYNLYRRVSCRSLS
jgi:hypothetical protein